MSVNISGTFSGRHNKWIMYTFQSKSLEYTSIYYSYNKWYFHYYSLSYRLFLLRSREQSSFRIRHCVHVGMKMSAPHTQETIFFRSLCLYYFQKDVFLNTCIVHLLWSYACSLIFLFCDFFYFFVFSCFYFLTFFLPFFLIIITNPYLYVSISSNYRVVRIPQIFFSSTSWINATLDRMI